MADHTRVFEIAQCNVDFLGDGTAQVRPVVPGPPKRVAGLTLGMPAMSRDAPHGGEMHPDGDELLVVLSGRVQISLELPEGESRVDLAPGQALVVPRGIWHNVHLLEESRLLHLTPGPGGDHRPL
jgi:mannose-6-phosphate isomerase-like protein (cupin superfamily)